MSLRRSAISGVTWTTLERLARQGLQFVFLVVLARLLGPDDFGVVALAGVYLMLVETVLALGTTTALVQRKHVRDEHFDTVFWYVVITALVMVVLTVAAAKPLAWLLGDARLELVLYLLAPKLLITGLSRVHDARLVRDLRFKSLAFRTMSGYFAGAALGLAMASQGFGVYSLVGQQLLTALVGTIFLWLATTWRPRRRYAWPALNELLPFGAAMVVNNLLFFVTKRADQAVTAAALGPTALGLLATSRRFAETGAEVLRSPLNVVLLPVLSKIQDEPERLASGVVRVQRIQAAITLPLFVGVACVAYDLIRVLLGPGWTDAGTLLSILATAEAVKVFAAFAHPLLIGSGKPRIAGRILFVQGVLTVVGSVIGANWGVEGVAIAVLINSAIGALMAVLVCRWLTPIRLRPLLAAASGPTFAALAMAAALFWVINDPAAELAAPLRLGVSIAAGALIYAAALAAIDRGAIAELVDTARQIARRRQPPQHATPREPEPPPPAEDTSAASPAARPRRTTP